MKAQGRRAGTGADEAARDSAVRPTVGSPLSKPKNAQNP